MVQMSMTVGKAEKSMGALVLIATIMVTKASKIFSVKSKSNISGIHSR